MNKTIRAWKDPAFRTTLDDADLGMMHESPVGVVGGVDSDLAGIVGGTGTGRAFTFYTCFTCQWASFGCTATCYPVPCG